MTKTEDNAALDRGQRTGRRLTAKLILVVLCLWSLFQIWFASPLPFVLNVGIFNATEARAIHLAFALFLAFTLFPPSKKRFNAELIPVWDWLFALAGAGSAAYLLVLSDELASRAGAPIAQDLVAAGIGITLVLEACRRSLGWPLTLVALIFLLYAFLGPYMPEVISHRGASLRRIATHQWLSQEGVFGVALGVSVSFVFLFVLFGALLERAGAGHYFIRVAYAFLGHMRGGPAKAAVVASGMSGVMSGSSIANVVTTGTFTIPLMRRVGFSSTKAGAIEVAASTTGQLAPPIMGAAAFLMVEYVGIPYIEVIKHALLPALISYIGLLYIVHLESCKLGIKGMPRGPVTPLLQRLLVWLTVIIGLILLSLAIHYGLGWVKVLFPEAASSIVAVMIVLSYLGLLAYASRFESPESDASIERIPPVGPTLKSGLYFLLPVVILIWCLTVERLSPQRSVFWAITALMLIVLTHRPLLAWFRRQNGIAAACRAGFRDFLEGLVNGSRNMVGIAIGTATAGMVVGTVTLTGIGLAMTELVELISGGNILLMLILTAVMSLILGLGLPTTANYIVVSTLMAPVIVTLGAENGLLVPLIAVHLFVFYFGILADATPPVGLAAYAAAGISRGDPIRTGVQGFFYDIRTAVLPFMFIFNNQLLLIGLTGWWDLMITIVSATLAMLVFAAATQGYWLVRSYRWESALLLLVAFSLFRPDAWWSQIHPAEIEKPASELYAVIERLGPEEALEIVAEGDTPERQDISRHMRITLPEGDTPEQRLAKWGVELVAEDGVKRVDFVDFASDADDSLIDFDWRITGVIVEQSRPAPEWVYLPTLLLLAGLGWNQWRRRPQET